MQYALENMPFAVSMFDESLQLVYANTLFFSMFNFSHSQKAQNISLESFIRFNKDFCEHSQKDASAMAKARLSMVKVSQFNRFEFTRQDGRVIEVVDRYMSPGGLFITYTDITEMRQTSDRLAGNEKKIQRNIRGRK